jgi:hypothetical protein
MAKGEHKKISRPLQGGYDISLDPQGHTVKEVRIRFGTLERKDKDENIYKWDLSIGPFEFNLDRKRAVIKVDDDQLPGPAHSCFYQMLCEIDHGEEATETLMTEPISLAEMTTTQSDFDQRSKVVQTALEGVFITDSSSALPTAQA